MIRGPEPDVPSMTELDGETSPNKRPRELDRASLDALLIALAPDRDDAGHRYEELRRRLINLFAWERCEAPEELADEVLNRLAVKINQGAAVPHMDRFAFGIARMVMQEQVRKQRNRQAFLREFQSSSRLDTPRPRDVEAVESCLAVLPAERRELIEQYYLSDRTALAARLGISLNALRNRAMRIREELFNCVVRKRDKS
jgi:DNA-directed RNA polymerase specialized sigma24 family protein